MHLIWEAIIKANIAIRLMHFSEDTILVPPDGIPTVVKSPSHSLTRKKVNGRRKLVQSPDYNN